MIKTEENNFIFKLITQTDGKTGATVLVGLRADANEEYSLPEYNIHNLKRSWAIKRGRIEYHERTLKYEIFDENRIEAFGDYIFFYPPETHGKLPAHQEEDLFNILLLLSEII